MSFNREYCSLLFISIFSVVLWSGATGISDKKGLSYSRFSRRNWRPLTSLGAKAGEVVICKVTTRFERFLNLHQFLLATDENTFITVYISGKGQGKVLEKDTEDLKTSTLDMDSCSNLGNGGYDPETSIARASKWLDQSFSYSSLRCSSKHWVNYWVMGRPGGHIYNPLSMSANKRCPPRTTITNPPPKLISPGITPLSSFKDEEE